LPEKLWRAFFAMISRIRELMHQMPFVPFVIYTTDGRNIKVPTTDHVAFSGKFSVVVTHDDGRIDYLPALHLSGVTLEPAAA